MGGPLFDSWLGQTDVGIRLYLTGLIKGHSHCVIIGLVSTTLLCLFVWLVGFLTSSSETKLFCGRLPGLASDNSGCCLMRRGGDHDFSLRRSHYTDTDTTSRERAVTAVIEPTTPTRGTLPTELMPPHPAWTNGGTFSLTLIEVWFQRP